MRQTRFGMAEQFKLAANTLESKRDNVIEALVQYETHATALVEIDKTVRALRTYSDELEFLVDRRPLGRVAVCLPYNNPLYSLVLYAFGPLIAGNEVICRPSRLTRGAVYTILDLLASDLSSCPLLLSDSPGPEFVDAAVEGMDALVFTGRYSSAADISQRMSSRRFIYSGPGVNPFGVSRTAVLRDAVDTVVYGRCFNSGQDCLAVERIYVETACADEFISQLEERARGLRVGRLGDPDTEVGPLVSAAAAAEVAKALDTRHVGRDTILGGGVEGSLVEPTLVVTTPTDPLVHMEKYAPVFVVVPVEDLAEMWQCMNSGDYLLGATFFGRETPDLSHPHVARNACLLRMEDADAHAPFGGRRHSGFISDHEGRRDGPIRFSVETTCEKEL